MGKNKKNETVTDKLSKIEFFGWQMRPISLGAMTIILGYLSLYCTTVLGLDAGILGVLLMVSKVFDGVTDLFAGYIIDNTKSKLGKARPYELSIIGVWICTVLMFAVPAGFSNVLKYIWIFFMYTMVFSVFTTLLNTAENPYIMRAFGTEKNITTVSSFGGIVITLGAMVVSISFPQAMSKVTNGDMSWTLLILLYAIPLTVVGLLRFLIVKEKPQYSHDDAKNEKVSIQDILTLLKKNRFVWFQGGLVGLNSMLTGFNAYSFYYTFIVGDIGAYSIVQMIGMLSMLLLVLFPVLMKKFSVVQLIITFGVVGIVGYAINFFAGANTGLLGIAMILTGSVALPLSYLQALIVMRICTYNEMIGLPRMEASGGMVGGFFNKVGNGIGLGLQGILLAVGGYVGSAAMQTEGALMMIRCMFSIIPAVMVVGIILFAALLIPLFRETEGKI